MKVLSVIAVMSSWQTLLPGAILTEIETGNEAGFQHAGSVSELACMPDGKHVLSSSRDQCTRLWEIKTGKLVRRFTAPGCGDVWGIQVIREGREFLAATSSGNIHRFEVASGKLLMSYKHSKSAYRIALMPDGEHFLGTDGGNSVTLWNIKTGGAVRQFAGHSDDVYTAIVVDEGKFLMTGSDDETVKQWDIETGECLKTLKGKKPYGDVFTLALSPDGGNFAMVSGDDYLRVFDVGTLDEKWKIKLGEEGEVVAWSPDGKLIACTSEDENLYLVNSADGAVVRKIKVSGSYHTPITFSNDGKTLISGGSYHLHLHDVSTGKRIEPEMGIPKKNFGYDHIAVTSGIDRIYLADGSKWEMRDRLDETKSQSFQENREVTAMTLSADGKLIAIAGSKGTVTIRETENFEEVQTLKAADAIQAFAFLPDGKGLITGGEDKVATHWEIESGKKIHEFAGHRKEIDTLVLSEDGELFFTTSRDGSVRVWSVKGRSEKAQYFTGSARPGAVAVLDGGRSLVVAVDQETVWGKILPPMKLKVEMKMEDVRALTNELGNEEFKKRQAAMLELATYGRRVLPVLDAMKVSNPEVRARILSVPDVLSGLIPLTGLQRVTELEDDLGDVASDPLGKLWVGVLGSEGASKLIVGDVDPEKVTLRILETVDLDHGILQATFSPDGSHLGTVNADGTYTLFSVKRD